jgi:pimeloyl-ACP methyl ester carboxylesterase
MFPMLQLSTYALLVGLAAAGGTPTEPKNALLHAPDRFLERPDARLRYRDLGGPGPVVVMLHGYSDDLTVFTRIADSLEGSYRVVALDQRGFGKSTIRPGARFGKAVAEDVIALLDHLGVEQAHLMGFSMGALVSSHAAYRFPDRVRSLTLLAGPFHPDSAAMAAFAAPYIAAMQRGEGVASFFQRVYPTFTDSAAKAVGARVWARNDSTSMVQALLGIGGVATTPAELRTIRKPTLVVIGTADPFLEASRTASRDIPGALFIELPDGTHGSPLGRLQWIPTFREMTAGASR